jgi:hypothetical protein
MDNLEIIFGSPARVKLMKLFVANPDAVYSNKDIARRSNITLIRARKEISALQKAHFVKRRSIREGGKRVYVWQINSEFPGLHSLQAFLLGDRSVLRRKLTRGLKNIGRVKLVIVSGVFIGRDDSRVDLVIAGDGLKGTKIDTIVKRIEADIGRELVYVVCNTEDFLYRLTAYDRFVRDVIDFPHETLLDKIGIGEN